MNDRYLYRAKHIHELPENNHLNGTWVTGYLSADNYLSNEDGDKLIDISTICQCTAKQDKNKKLIFENDLVEINGTVYQCFWNDSNFEWGFKNNSEDFGIAYVSSDDIRIAGNIFDNPELLEVGE